MSRFKRGFTMIEVSLFLVITGALFVGIAVGTQNSIYQQRYNDAVQNYAEFLRTVYSEVTNVESEGDGRSETAIYGKLVTFGESTNLAGETVKNGEHAIYTYNVIGKVGELPSGNILTTLKSLKANVVKKGEDGKVVSVGLVSSYKPRWAAAIQQPGSTNSFVGALLIIRHPGSGTVYTYVMKGETVQVNRAISLSGADGVVPDLLSSYLGSGKFKNEKIDFCVNPNGIGEGGQRRDVRIQKGARNGSGVEIMTDGEETCQL